MKKSFRINKSASRTIAILEYLAGCEHASNLTEISRDLNIPKSSCFEIIQTLSEFKAITVVDEILKTYRVGIKIFQIGSSVLYQTDLYLVAHLAIDELSKKLNETVFLAVEEYGKIVYIDKAEGKQMVRSTCVIGSKNDMHTTGLGKALLACYDQQKVDEIIDRYSLVVKTKYTISNKNLLMKNLEKTRKLGYAIDNEEYMELVKCVAAPIFDAGNNPVAAISIATLSARADDNYLKNLGEQISATALEISKKIGYLKEKLF